MPSGSTSAANTVKSGVPEDEKGEFEAKLEGLPEKYREEILKQYDLPETKASLISILKHATGIEILLMIVGTLMSIASGTPSSFPIVDKSPSSSYTNVSLQEPCSSPSMKLIFRRRTTFNDRGLWRFNKCLWRNYNSGLLRRHKRFLHRRFE